MPLIFESVLLLYRGNNNKTFACRVKCQSSSKKAKTLRILTVHHWQLFDEYMEHFFCSKEFLKEYDKFHLMDFEFEIKKSNVHFHSLKECLGNTELSDLDDTSYVWDCCIQMTNNYLSKNDHKNDLEYEPLAINCSSETLPNITYKPSKLEELDLKDDSYQPISLNSTKSSESASPEYKPSPINSKGNKKSKQLADTDDVISESEHETTSNALYTPLRLKRKVKYIPSSQEGKERRPTPVPEYIPTPINITSAKEKSNQQSTPANVNIKDFKKPLKEHFSHLESRANEIDHANLTKEETITLNSSTSLSSCDSKNFSEVDVNQLDSSFESEKCKSTLKDVAPLRRSARSSVKTQRLIEHLDNVKGPKRKKVKEIESMQQIVNLKHKQVIKERERLNQIQPLSTKITTDLSLKGISLDEVMSTFEQYKCYLDDIYRECYKKNHIKTFNGLNHCLVINLIEEKVQSKMLQKISNVYSGLKNVQHPTMFGNAMLPEWLTRIFMDKHKLTRTEAIEQIKMQEANKLDGDENVKERLLNFDIE